MPVRVRFAPSPTGLLHVGALRTALYDWLYARHEGGQLILRIEDTDRSRYNADSEKEFIETLEWTGIKFDEGPHVGGPFGPYRQSERAAVGIYQPYIDRLLADDKAYKAFDTPEELEAMRTRQAEAKEAIGYFGGAWREATPDQVAAAEAVGKPYVIRLKIPRAVTLRMVDAIRGEIEWHSDTVDDPVLIKADGMPTYHFAAMVDDHLMEITHVLRGDEWISSAPKHVALFQAFSWEMPIFVHCPVIVGNDGKKLSKRHGATRVLDYAAEGFMAEPLLNFVALIGWSPGDDREAMTVSELVETFSLRGLQPSPGKFDLEKLKWLNGHRIREMSVEAIDDAIRAYVAEPFTRSFWTGIDEETQKPRGEHIWARLERFVAADPTYARATIPLAQPRVTTLADFGEVCDFFFVDAPEMDAAAEAKWLSDGCAKPLLASVLAAVEAADDLSHDSCEAIVRSVAEQHGLAKLGPLVHPLRVALTGKTAGPGLFELMAVLGRDRMITRLRAQAQ